MRFDHVKIRNCWKMLFCHCKRKPLTFCWKKVLFVQWDTFKHTKTFCWQNVLIFLFNSQEKCIFYRLQMFNTKMSWYYQTTWFSLTINCFFSNPSYKCNFLIESPKNRCPTNNIFKKYNNLKLSFKKMCLFGNTSGEKSCFFWTFSKSCHDSFWKPFR